MSNLNPYSIAELLPTVQTGGIALHPTGRGNRYLCGEALQEAVSTGLLPTPVTQGLKVQDGDGSMRPMPLELLPTPRAKDWKGGQVVEGKTVTRLSGETYSSSIGDLARSGLLPTPVSRYFKGSNSPDAMLRKDGKPRTDMLSNLPTMLGNHSRQTGGATSQLNPLFVAEMMGFPREWLIYPFLGRNGGRNQ